MESTESKITLVIQRADGHHTVRGDTVREVMAQLHQLEEALGFQRETPVLVHEAGQPTTSAVQPGEWRCPDHPARKPVAGKNGAPYTFCSARLQDGSWCTQRSDRQAA